MAKKERIDTLLVEHGYFSSREKAKRSIMAGLVYVNDEMIIKPGEKVAVDKAIRVKKHEMPYVSRGGFKLKKAIDCFSLDLTNHVMLDIGSSTGGFSDCGLQHGVQFVYALDVGTNQLDWKLRSHPQVKVMEKTNFRYATRAMFEEGIPTFASIDVSFISLKLILPVLFTIMDEGNVIALIKPQFEAGKENVGKNGIVRDAHIHQAVIRDIAQFAINTGFHVRGLTHSPIKGSGGNREFLIWLTKHHQQINNINLEEVIHDVVLEAHQLE